MRKKIRFIFSWLFLLLLILFCRTGVWANDLIAIANTTVPVTSIKKSEIADIYLGEKTKWSDNSKIYVVMLKSGDTHEKFVQDIVGTTPSKLITIWNKAIFAGTGSPPKILKTDADMLNFVLNTKGAIGYINAASPHAGVKLISVD